MSQNFKQPGRMLTFLASLIVCPSLDNLPKAGDVVTVGAGIYGIAESTAAATTDKIPVNTVGVFNIPVVGKHAGAVNDAVAVGDKLYVTVASAVVSKDAGQAYFGTALGAVNAGATTSIDVRLAGQ